MSKLQAVAKKMAKN